MKNKIKKNNKMVLFLIESIKKTIKVNFNRYII